LFQTGEILFSSLATMHNLRRYLVIMSEIRQAILEGRFGQYLRTVRSQNEAA
jgi:queuine tRNA-ribosyltransferase